MAAPKPWKRAVADAHVISICRKHGIAIRWLKGRDWHDQAEASEVARMVHIPHSNNARQYLVALHEIGHILSPIRYSLKAEWPGWSAGTFHLACEASADAWLAENLHPELDKLIKVSDFEAVVGHGFASHAWSVAVYAVNG